MRRTKKVTKNNAGEKAQLAAVRGIGNRTVREKLESLTQRVSKLQGARLGAEGLYNVLGFCADEFEERESAGHCLQSGMVVDPLLEGLSEVALMLYKTLRRETDAMERELWEFDTEKLKTEPIITQCDLSDLVTLRDQADRKDKAIGEALANGARVLSGAFSVRLNNKGRVVVG